MQCIATSAQGLPRITGAERPALFTAFPTLQADVIGLYLFESAAGRVSLTLKHCPLLEHIMFCIPPWPPTHGSHHWCWWGVQGVFHHLLSQHTTKIQLGLRSFGPPASSRLYCIHLGDRTQKCKLPHCPPLRLLSLL